LYPGMLTALVITFIVTLMGCSPLASPAYS
jgi:hypothetical protein